MKEFWTNFTQGYDGSGEIGSASMQILLMLLGAFILGYLLRYFLGRGRSGKDKAEIDELKASNKRLRDELDAVKKKTVSTDKLGSIKAELDDARRKNRSLERDLLTAGAAAPGIDSDQGAEIEALKRTNDKLNSELEDCRKRASNPSVTSMAVAAVSVGKPASPDDLTKIEGIGKKIQEHLNNGDVWSFDQLANTVVSRLQEILDAAGPAYTMHDPDTWPEQGGLARDGHWEKLEKWQSELKGGRKRKKR